MFFRIWDYDHINYIEYIGNIYALEMLIDSNHIIF